MNSSMSLKKSDRKQSLLVDIAM